MLEINDIVLYCIERQMPERALPSKRLYISLKRIRGSREITNTTKNASFACNNREASNSYDTTQYAAARSVTGMDMA